jgi:DNA polymerase-3 subunit delta'
MNLFAMTPMPFSKILGQEKAKAFLRQVMAKQKIPHAYLFAGIPGIGKTTTAMSLAMALNCRQPPNGDSCGRCVSCRQMMDGNAPDFVSIAPDGKNIKIDQVRSLNRSLAFAPVSGQYRVCIFQKAETMTDEAANSFLKTLEEPPPGNILILNATEPLDLLPTIVSRCQKVGFQPLSRDEITHWLQDKQDVDEEAARILAALSRGSLGRALGMWEENFLEKRQEWIYKLLNLTGLSDAETLSLALECADAHRQPGRNAAYIQETGLTEILDMWEGWYRDLLVLKAESDEGLIINVDFSQKLKKMAVGFTIERLTESILLIDQARRDLRRQLNPTLVMGHTVLKLKRHGKDRD